MNNKQIIKKLVLQEWRLIYRTARGQKIFTSFFLIQLAQICILMNVIENNFFPKNYFILLMLAGYGGASLLAYLQFGMAWQGASLAMFFSRQVTIKHLLWSKYLFSILAAFFSLIIPLLIFICWGNLFFATALIAIIMYVGGFTTILSCTAYKKFKSKIDIGAKGILANWKGMGAAQHILGIVYIVPIVIIVGIPAYFKFNEWYSVITLALLGLAMLIIAFRFIAFASYGNDKYFLINTFAS